jgi:hypothetical protein
MKTAKMIAMLLSLMTVVFISCKKDNTEYLLVNKRPEPVAQRTSMIILNENPETAPSQDIFPGTKNFNVMAFSFTPNFSGVLNSISVNIAPVVASNSNNTLGWQNVETVKMVNIGAEYSTQVGNPVSVVSSYLEFNNLYFSVKKDTRCSFVIIVDVSPSAVPFSVFQLSLAGINATDENGTVVSSKGGTIGSIMYIRKIYK